VDMIYDLDIVQNRLKYVLLVRDNQMTISEASAESGVSWKMMKNWIC